MLRYDCGGVFVLLGETRIRAPRLEIGMGCTQRTENGPCGTRFTSNIYSVNQNQPCEDVCPLQGVYGVSPRKTGLRQVGMFQTVRLLPRQAVGRGPRCFTLA
jgi:hypothetical protein